MASPSSFFLALHSNAREGEGFNYIGLQSNRIRVLNESVCVWISLIQTFYDSANKIRRERNTVKREEEKKDISGRAQSK